MSQIVIIGNGIAGITAARHIRKKSDQEILVISGESPHFFSRTALMYVFMGHMRWQDIKPYEDWFWKKNRINLEFDWVTQIEFHDKSIHTKSGKKIHYDKLILALGSKPNKFGWPGQDLKRVQGLYSKQDLENLESLAPTIKKAIIVGGGLIGVELAEMLRSKNIELSFLIREKKFWNNVLPDSDAEFITQHLKKHHIDLRFETELAEIIDDGHGNACGVITKTGEKISCDFVGLTAGVTPNIELIKNTELKTKTGILVNSFLETSVKDVYAIGDCAEISEPIDGRKAVEQVWYTGRIMGETLAATICGARTAYNPGPWFNSAKFFDVEFQTYGHVPAQLDESLDHFFWQHPVMEKCLHVVWKKESKEFSGINVFGIRLRHELFDQWLRNKATIQHVMENLSAANFDPEFYVSHEADIIQMFNSQKGFNVRAAKKIWWQKLIQSL